MTKKTKEQKEDEEIMKYLNSIYEELDEAIAQKRLPKGNFPKLHKFCSDMEDEINGV